MPLNNNNLKGRVWSFIIYPQDNNFWLDRLLNTHLKFCVSPLHDADIWNENDISLKKEYCEKNNIKVGDTKKHHYHVMIAYNNSTTLNCIENIIYPLDIGVTYIERVSSPVGYYDYMSHKYNEEKHKYNEKDIKFYNGFNISDYIELTSKETLNIKKFLFDFIKLKKITSFDNLINWLMYLNLDDELYVVTTNYSLFNTYCKSRNDRAKSLGTGNIQEILDNPINIDESEFK